MFKTRKQFFEKDAMRDWYVSNCPACDCEYAVTKRMEERRRADGNSFYCPNGHSMSFDGENEKVRRERDRLKQEVARLQDEKAVAVRETEKARAQTLQARRRAVAGVCPCCNRTCQNVQRHMKSKHPNVVPLAQKTAS